MVAATVLVAYRNNVARFSLRQNSFFAEGTDTLLSLTAGGGATDLLSHHTLKKPRRSTMHGEQTGNKGQETCKS